MKHVIYRDLELEREQAMQEDMLRRAQLEAEAKQLAEDQLKRQELHKWASRCAPFNRTYSV